MHKLTDTLAAKVAIAVNVETDVVQPIQIVEGEPIKLVCPFASTGKHWYDMKMAADIAEDFLATQPWWVVVVAVQFADGLCCYYADFKRYNAEWTQKPIGNRKG